MTSQDFEMYEWKQNLSTLEIPPYRQPIKRKQNSSNNRFLNIIIYTPSNRYSSYERIFKAHIIIGKFNSNESNEDMKQNLMEGA